MKKLKLSNSKFFALIDDEFEIALSRWKWFLTSKGYVSRTGRSRTGKKQIFLHRIIASLEFGDDTLKFSIDHADRNKLNNIVSNLRLATHQENCRNRGSKIGATSRFRGVSFRRKKWEASIRVKGISKWLGSFHTEKAAAKAYNLAAKKYFGKFAFQNLI